MRSLSHHLEQDGAAGSVGYNGRDDKETRGVFEPMTQSRLYYRVPRDGSDGITVPVECFPGQIVKCDDPTDVKFFYKKPVPDPDHQSSLDYLKGV